MELCHALHLPPSDNHCTNASIESSFTSLYGHNSLALLNQHSDEIITCAVMSFLVAVNGKYMS